MGQASTVPLPTALVHFLVVELLPVWGFGLATLSAGKKFVSQEVFDTIFLGPLPSEEEYLKASGPSGRSLSHSERAQEVVVPPTVLDHMNCVDKAVDAFLFTQQASVASCPGCQHPLYCRHSFLPQGMVLVLYGALSLMALLALWSIGSFASNGLLLASFGAGEYLQFCWSLEQALTFRVLAGVMSAATTAVIVGIFVVSLTADTRRSMAQLIGFEAITLGICLRRLLVPKTRIYDWLRPGSLDGIVFRREWIRWLVQPNDVVSQQLVDCLWKAKHGARGSLQRMLVDPADADRVLESCAQLRQKEGDMTDSSGDEGFEMELKS